MLISRRAPSLSFLVIMLCMRRLIILFGVLALVLASGVYWLRSGAQAAPYAPTGPGDVYVALGDSLAAGFTTSRPQDAYVARIAAEIKQRQPLAVRNFAVAGETSASMLRRQLPQALNFIQQQRDAGKRVSPITLDIGGNDARPVERASLDVRKRTIATIEANLGTALDQLIAATSTPLGTRTADIAVMTYYNPFPGDPSDQNSAAYWSDQLNAAITRAATARGVAVADVASAFAGGNVYRYTYIASGDIHANSDGHALIAERFLAALRYDQKR